MLLTQKRVGHPWLTLLGGVLIVLLVLPSPNTVRHWFFNHGFITHSVTSSDKVKQLTNAILRAPKQYFTGEKNLPLLQLDIKYQDWMKIVADRNKALALGQIPEQRAQVKASISYLQKKHNAKVRLQGDLLDHVEASDRWSLRIEIKGKNTLFGVKRFALLSPHLRGNQAPILFTQTLKLAEFDIINPKYVVVKLLVNGTSWGTMLLEEVFSKELLAKNNRTEGVILKLEQALTTSSEQGELSKVFRPKVFQRSATIANPVLNKQRKMAINLLSDLLNKQRSPSDVLDSRKWGQYLATVDLWSAWHALSWNNIRFYYNPHTAKLEPIQSDAGLSPVADNILLQPVTKQFPMFKWILSDTKIAEQYRIALEKLVSLAQNFQLNTHLSLVQNKIIKKMARGLPLLTPYRFTILEQHAQCLLQGCTKLATMPEIWHQHLQIFRAELPWDLASKFIVQQGRRQLVLRNNHQPTVDILDLTVMDKLGGELALSNMPELPFTLAANQINTNFSLDDSQAHSIQLLTRQYGSKLQSYHFTLGEQATEFLPRPVASQKIPDFIEVQDGRWQFLPGSWLLDEYLVTPENTQVYIPANTNVRFTSEAGLLIFGSLYVNGSAEQPVRFSGRNKKTWQGVSVFGQGEKSQVKHFSLDTSGSPKQGLWRPKGALYFYDVDLDASYLYISNNHSEDALNIVKSQFNLEYLHIENAYSDGFDCDFCRGQIKYSRFVNIGIRSGGDALDISGSQVLVEHSTFERIKDKAISAGEASWVTAKQIKLRQTAFGIVAKDGSTVQVSNISGLDVKYAMFMAYIKKPLFGGASLYVKQFDCKNCNNISILQESNHLVLDGVPQKGQHVNVKKLYNNVMRSDKPQ